MRNLLLRTTLTTTALAALLFSALLLPRNAASQRVNQLSHAPARQSPSTSPSSTDSSSTSQADQTDLSLTVYNSDLALVRDVREVTLPAGDFRLKFMDVGASMNPATV